jgi:hypothetical protein
MKSSPSDARPPLPREARFGFTTFKTIRAVCYAAAGLLVAGQVLGELLKSVQSSKSFGLPDELAAFDSFSQPSLAVRVLKQQTERLFFAYTVARDEAAAARSRRKDENGDAPNPQGTLGEVRSMAELREQSAPMALAVEQMQQLRSEIAALNLDLDRRLTALYYDQHLWNDFLDGYLRLLQEGPERAHVVPWEWCALESARACGRTEEIVGALRQLIEFRAIPKTARGLRTVLDEWQNQAVGTRSTTSHFGPDQSLDAELVPTTEGVSKQ